MLKSGLIILPNQAKNPTFYVYKNKTQLKSIGYLIEYTIIFIAWTRATLISITDCYIRSTFTQANILIIQPTAYPPVHYPFLQKGRRESWITNLLEVDGDVDAARLPRINWKIVRAN